MLKSLGASRRRPPLALLVVVLLVSPVARSELPDPLVVTSSAHWKPFSFINAEGQPDGIFTDLWRELGQATGVEVQFLLLDWQDSLDALGDGRADVHAGMLRSTDREPLFEFSAGIFDATARLFVSPRLGVAALRDLANLPVGIVAGGYDAEFVRNTYPDLTLRAYPNTEALVGAAVAGRIAAFVIDMPSAMYHLNALGEPGQFIAAESVYTETFRAAVGKGRIDLLRDINAALALLPKSEVARIRERWIVTEKPAVGWLSPRLVAAVATALLLLMGIYNLMLLSRLRSRNREVSAIVAELEDANHSLGELSSSDPLTGVANRRHFYDIAWRELAAARRYEHPLALMLLDVDNIRDINDTHGQAIGDQALVHLTHQLQRQLRETDLLARHGGEEFVVLMPSTALEGACLLAGRMLENATKHSLLSGTLEIPVLFSAGVVALQGQEDLDVLLARADHAMAAAKRDGRARIVHDP